MTSQSGTDPYARTDAVHIGTLSEFTSLPQAIEVCGATYFLTRHDGAFKLLSTTCPHMGGQVRRAKDCFACPVHGWRFDLQSGACKNAPGQALQAFPVRVEGDELVADLPAQKASGSVRVDREAHRSEVPAGLSIELLAHACLDFRYDGFSLLTDPWLSGPAFLGAWTQYPAPQADAHALRPDAIWISHEHSDHFHEPTLRCFDRDVPVYFPDFPNQRLQRRLQALGFRRLHAMPFGERMQLNADIALTCFEPGSLWNDSMVLIEINGFRVLNINDAGLNRRIAAQVYPVDMITSAFTTGASGFPLTWTHLSDAEKSRIIDRSNGGFRVMLKEAAALYGARYLLPFAGHFLLWHPSHRAYVPMLKKNSLDDIGRVFAGRSDVRVIDVLPGERWQAQADRIERAWSASARRQMYEADTMLRFVAERFDEAEFRAHHPQDDVVTEDDVSAYFMRLNDVPEIAFCEDLTMEVAASDRALCLGFAIEDGRIRRLMNPPDRPNLRIHLPASVLRHLIVEEDSWDEAHIGYWCRFDRHPDVYHAGLWRLLQAPYFRRSAQTGTQSAGVSQTSAIAQLVQDHGDTAERILRRYGLYCGGCHLSTWETLEQGARKHGLGTALTRRLVQELDAVLS